MKYLYLTTSIVLGFSFLSLAEQNLSIDLKAWYKQFKIEKPIDYDSLIRFTNQKIVELEGFQFISIDKQKEKEKYKGHLNLRLGNAYREVNQIELALESYENAIKFYQFSGYSKGSLGHSYMNAASVYRLKKDFVKSNAFYEAAERIYKENKKYKDLFDVYFEQINNYDLEGLSPFNPNIIKLYQKAKQIEGIDEWKKISLELIVTCQQFVENEKYNDAISIIDEAIKVFEDNGFTNLKIETLIGKADLLIKKMKRYDEAKKVLDLIDEIVETQSVNLKLYNAEAYLLLTKAAYHTALSQYHQAQNYHQQILKFINPLFTYKTIYQNPSPNQIVGNPYLLTTLADKAEIFKKMYAQTSNKTNLTQALNCYELSYAAADEMRKKYSFENANTYLSDYTYSYYEKAIELCQTLAEVFPEQQNEYQQKAFEIAQRSSMKTLFWKINSKYAEKNLPQATKIKLNVLRKDITDLERKIDEDLNNNSLKTKRFETQQELEATINIAEKLTVYNKFKPNLINQKKLQTNLKPNQALLNYFVGDSLIYCFLVTKNKFQIIEIENPKVIIKKVVDFRNAIDANEIANDLAHQLYQQLLQNILTEFPNQINSLIIIPDGILSALPFEALQKTNNYNDYLLKHYTISYDLHSYFLTKTKTQSNPIKISAASFSVEDFSNWESMQLPYLPNSKKETDNLNSFVKGATFPQATKQQFLQHFSNASIVHVSSHAQADTLDAANSCIIFSRNNEAESDDLLTRDEILNYKCTAEMIVLSACETGVGKLNKGEGIASLARAFRTIGSKSEVMSLWKIYDGTTAIIMTSFYKFLKKGYPKNKALQKAKLQYLKNQSTDSRKHPKNWAGLVLQGNVEALF